MKCLPLLISIFATTVCACGDPTGDYLYSAIGASDAVGVGAEPPSEGYVFRLEDNFDNCRSDEVGLLNLGIPAAEIPEINDAEVPAATEADPEVITVWTGANDIVAGRTAADFEGRFEDLLAELTENTSAVIAVGTIPNLTMLPRFQEEPDPDVTTARVDAYNAAIIRQATRFNVPVANLAMLELTEALVSDKDGFHPNSEGHAEIAVVFFATLQEEVCNQ